MPQHEFETASGNIAVKADSPPGTDRFKEFMERAYQLMQILKSGLPNATDQFVEGAWLLIGDYPDEANGYVNIITAISIYENTGASAKARAVAEKMIASSAPQSFKQWAQGFLNRKDNGNEPLDLEFIALDGRLVDLKQMRGKVVLIVFWDTSCGACEVELPRLKAAWDKFHSLGLEIIGISGDIDKIELEQFVQNHEIPWPQFFEGKQFIENKYFAAFGIGSIPHMFFVNRNGLLCWDRVRASNGSFEKIISILLSEQINP